jgi:hypothetical protein
MAEREEAIAATEISLEFGGAFHQNYSEAGGDPSCPLRQQYPLAADGPGARH